MPSGRDATPTPTPTPPVVIGSSLTGLLVSLSLSRAGIEHVLIGGDEPAASLRLGEALNDTAGPELWRLYGRELAECFHLKSHIAYFNGNFSTVIQLASPLRSRRRIDRFARPEAGYPWLGQGLFHLDRRTFDPAIYRKARAQEPCRFVRGRIAGIVRDADDRIARIEIDGAPVIERPRYVFDCTGFASPVAAAAGVGTRELGPLQRVVFAHHELAPGRTDGRASCPPRGERAREWWRHGTNLIKLDADFDGTAGLAWLIPLGDTLSVGISVDAAGPHGSDDARALLGSIEAASARRGLDYRAVFPGDRDVQELRHGYFVRERAAGANWLLVGGSYLTVWFSSAAGLATATAAASMAPALVERPELGAYYEKAMAGLVPFHELLDGVARGPCHRSSLQVYRFFGRGTSFIWSRLAHHFRIRDNDYGWFKPASWALQALALLGRVLPPLMLVLFGFAVIHNRMEPDRRRLARPLPLYRYSIPFRCWNAIRALPQLLFSAIPRRSIRPSAAVSSPACGPAGPGRACP